MRRGTLTGYTHGVHSRGTLGVPHVQRRAQPRGLGLNTRIHTAASAKSSGRD